jgi:hypothetical protein
LPGPSTWAPGSSSTTFQATDGFLLLDAAQLTFGDEPAPATYFAHYFGFGDVFAKASYQLLVRFVGSFSYFNQKESPLFKYDTLNLVDGKQDVAICT